MFFFKKREMAYFSRFSSFIKTLIKAASLASFIKYLWAIKHKPKYKSFLYWIPSLFKPATPFLILLISFSDVCLFVAGLANKPVLAVANGSYIFLFSNISTRVRRELLRDAILSAPECKSGMLCFRQLIGPLNVDGRVEWDL